MYRIGYHYKATNENEYIFKYTCAYIQTHVILILNICIYASAFIGHKIPTKGIFAHHN